MFWTILLPSMPVTYDERFASGFATTTPAALINPLAQAFPTKFSRIRPLAIKLLHLFVIGPVFCLSRPRHQVRSK
jgi:hypothetical protein